MLKPATEAWSTALDKRSPRAPARGCSLGWPAVLVAAVLYGSLIPFHLDGSVYSPRNLFGLSALQLAPAGLADVITNLLVYFPVGLSLILCVRGGPLERLERVPLVIAMGVSVSIVAEVLQVGLPERVASWTDVMLNAAGTALGGLFGAGLRGVAVRGLQQVRGGLAARPFTTIATVLALGLFLYGLAPFDFVTDTDGLHSSFGRARWDLAALRVPDTGAGALHSVYKQAGGAAWFCLLGYLLVLGKRETRCHGSVALASALKHGCILVCLIECVQLFTNSHCFDLATVVLRGFALSIGAWYAAFIVREDSIERWKRVPGHAAPTALLVLVGALQLAAILGPLVFGWPWGARPASLARVHWIPFETLWLRPMNSAAAEIIVLLATYGTLALTFEIALRRVRVPAAWLITAVGVALVAALVESLQAVTVAGAPDITGPILAGAAALGASRLYVILWSTPAAGQRPAPAPF